MRAYLMLLIEAVPWLVWSGLLAGSGPGQERLQEPLMRTPPPGLDASSDGQLRAEGCGWRARIAAGGIEVQVPSLEDSGPMPTLGLRFHGALRDGVPCAEASDVTPIAAGSTAFYQRGLVVERYEPRPEGLEQTFEITAPPKGVGDLVISLRIFGNVIRPLARPPKHGTVEFSFQGQRVLRYGEAVVLDRVGHRVELATRLNEEFLELIVPGSFLEGATFPVLIDPVIGPVFNPGGAGWQDVNPDVAYDDQQRTYLVVWQRNLGGKQIRAALYDQDGIAITPLIFVENGAEDAENPAVAFFSGAGALANNRFFVVWQQTTDGGTTSNIQGRLVDADNGALPTASFAVSTVPAAGWKDRRPAVAGGPPMMVVWDRTLPGVSTPSEIRGRSLYWFHLGDPAGVTLEPNRVLTSVGSGYVRNARLGQSSLVMDVAGAPWSVWRAVWERFYTAPAPGDFDVRTLGFRTRSGAVPGYAVIDAEEAVPGAGAVGAHETQPDIALSAPDIFTPAAARYLIAWQDEEDILGHRYSTTAQVGGVIDIQTSAGAQYGPAVGAGACEFTVAYLELDGGEFDLDVYAARVLLDGSVPTNHRVIDDPGNVYQDHLRASSRPVPYAAGNERNTSMIVWRGQTGPAAASLEDVRARFFEPLAGTTSFFGAACPGPGAALPTIGYAGGRPHPGNSGFAITLNGAPPVVPALLVLGLTAINDPIPGTVGCRLYSGPPYSFFPTMTSAAGTAFVPIPIPCDPGLEGLLVACQWGVNVPGFNALGWITSNDLDLTWSQ